MEVIPIGTQKEDSKILQKTYDMILYGYICLGKYPNSERHTLVAETKLAMFELLKNIIRADKRYYKKNTIQDADIQNKTLQYYMRLGMNMRFLPPKKYEHWSKMTVEIGKMIGGWLKSTIR